jgi:hypothetical protein
MHKLLLLSVVFLLVSPILPAQQTLDNEAVIQLAKTGLSDDLLVTTINARPGHYDVSPNGLTALKAAQLSDKVVAAIVLKANRRSENAASGTDTAVAAPGSPATGPNGLPVGIEDVGVYYRDKNGAWVPLLPEIVIFQSTGKIKDIATAGIVRSDLDGRIGGAHSRFNVELPAVFAVYLPATAEITEYVLLELHSDSNTRTFLSAEGGLLHTRAGAHRDEIAYQPEKLAPRLYQITLPAIEGKGEFGLLAPGTQSTPNKEVSGTIYTVSVTE